MAKKGKQVNGRQDEGPERDPRIAEEEAALARFEAEVTPSSYHSAPIAKNYPQGHARCSDEAVVWGICQRSQNSIQS